MRRLLAACLLALLACGPATAADAERRVALVVGNGAYLHTEPLPNPPNDARDMAQALRRTGFEVLEGRDLDRRGLERLVRDFAREIRGAEAALFFYAGHGLEVAGRNYLVPVDAELELPSDLPFEAVGLDTVTGAMDAPALTSLVFLDACRDNPLARSLARGARRDRSLDVGRGLAQMDAPAGMFVAFATRPGTTAADGTGRNSPFTEALLANLAMPGLEVRQVLTRVRRDVLRATGNLQQPWDESSLVEDFYFVPPQGVPPAVPTPALPAAADQEQAAFWEGVLRSAGDPGPLEEYLRRFPDGPLARLARRRLDELGTGSTTGRRTAPEPQVAALARTEALDERRSVPELPPQSREQAVLPVARPPAVPATSALPDDIAARSEPLKFGGEPVRWQDASVTRETRLRVPGFGTPTRRWRLEGTFGDSYSTRRLKVEGEAISSSNGEEIAVVFFISKGIRPSGSDVHVEDSRNGWSILNNSSRIVDSGSINPFLANFFFNYDIYNVNLFDRQRSCLMFMGNIAGSSVGGFLCAPPGTNLDKASASEFLRGIKVGV